MMRDSFDAVIVGGGIVGAAIAAACAKAGMHVALVERDVIGGGATAAGMGHIVVMDDSEAQFALTRYSQLLWAELALGLPPESNMKRPEPYGWQRMMKRWPRLNGSSGSIANEMLRRAFSSARELTRLEPNIAPGLAGALLVPEDAVIYPPTAALYLVHGRRGSWRHRDHRAQCWSPMGDGRVLLDDHGN